MFQLIIYFLIYVYKSLSKCFGDIDINRLKFSHEKLLKYIFQPNDIDIHHFLQDKDIYLALSMWLMCPSFLYILFYFIDII